MNPADKIIVLEFKKKLTKNILSHVKKLIMFGSRARGDADQNSDLDVVALVDKKDAILERQLEDVAYQVMWDHNFEPIISLKVFDENQFNKAAKRGFSFYNHVLDEGIII